jgi:hypothetical protein
MVRPIKEQIRELPVYIGLSLVDIHIIDNEVDIANACASLISAA